jgi:hypothetical protein
MNRGVKWRSAGILVVLAVVGARTSEAGELNLSVQSKVGYDSNVFNGNPDDVETAVIMFQPEGSVSDTLERGSYLVSYSPSYFINTSKNARNTWNHRVQVGGTYYFSPRTSLSLTDNFLFLEKMVYSPSDPDDDANIDDSNRQTTTNAVDLSFNHLLTRRLSLFSNGRYKIYRYDRKRSEDSDNFGGSAGLRYMLNQQLSVGGGGQVSYWSFDSREPQSSVVCGGESGPGSRTLSYSGFASANYQYDETTSFQMRAGPAWIDSKQFLCTGLLPSDFDRQDTDQTTWFAEASLHKRWQHVKGSLSYQRSEGTYGSAGQTSVNDSVTGRLDWQPARFWDLELRLGWIRRSQEGARNTTTQVRQNPETNLFTAAFKVSRQIAKRTRVFADVSYRDQNQDVNLDNPLNLPPAFLPTTRDGDGFDTWRAFFGITYALDPIRY